MKLFIVNSIKSQSWSKFYVVLFLLLIFQVQLSYTQTTLKIARIENHPDQYVGGEILKEVYKRLNIQVEFVDLPALRCLQESSTGNLDGEVHRNINVQNQYPDLIMVKPAINYIEPSVFSFDSSIMVKDWDSIKDYSITIVRGVGSSEDGTKGMKNVTAVTQPEQMFNMLDKNRATIAICDAFSGLVLLKEMKLENKIFLIKPPLQRIYIYHFLNKKNIDLVPKVEKVLKEMQESGELELLRQRIIRNYLSKDGVSKG